MLEKNGTSRVKERNCLFDTGGWSLEGWKAGRLEGLKAGGWRPDEAEKAGEPEVGKLEGACRRAGGNRGTGERLFV